MMNNILYMILSQVILVAWLKFNFNSSLYEIYPKLYDTVDILKIKERYNNFSIDLILFNGILSFVLFRNNVNVSLSIPIILSLAQFLESSFTDVIIKEVNRHSLRFVYIVLYFYSMFYLTSQGRVLDIIIINVSLVILFLMLLFSNNIGASDIRAFFIAIMLYTLFKTDYNIWFITLHLIGIQLYINYNLKKQSNKSEGVPICHVILLPPTILSLTLLLTL